VVIVFVVIRHRAGVFGLREATVRSWESRYDIEARLERVCLSYDGAKLFSFSSFLACSLRGVGGLRAATVVTERLHSSPTLSTAFELED
jgi:hypothetical protein